MKEAQIVFIRGIEDGTVDFRTGMNGFGPSCPVSLKKAKLIIGRSVGKLSHEHVFTRNSERAIESPVFYSLVKILFQRFRDKFIGIDNKDPFMGSRFYSKIACGFTYLIVSFGKRYDFASITRGDFDCPVSTLHVTD